ncbi:PREDICTED: non-specific lipid transfer protein GPI-anchored 2-like isoform X2 [Populus euphratica]|uniref:Non-specific lipid transfer protein GPI-anchored 2-like isoform X2 n=2 Tax=Populus euphratica TaxID=75702 RepID=A0AAJ6T8T7_POPEU|nr:PREDICTED: non-specific lipid transfer protein GPI-anchored 2-like isoform X2 [Populus euphratica]
MSKPGITTVILTLALISTVPANMAAAPAPAEAPAPVSGLGSATPAPVEAPPPVSGLGPAASGPAPGNDCITPVLNASDCLDYVTTGSNLTVPDKNCCPEIAGLIESNILCLCQLLSGDVAKQYGLSIDYGRAVKLPAVCKIANVPSASLCSVVGYPVPAPASGPSTGLPPLVPAAESPGGLAASPSAGENDAASSIAGSAFAVFGGLAFSILSTLF